MNQQSNSPSDRYCDLVMKGGITSGIVYPLAILELAKHYRLEEYRWDLCGSDRRCRRGCCGIPAPPDGFNGWLQTSCRTATRTRPACLWWRSRLLGLFQPHTSCRRLFKVLVYALNRKTTLRRTGAIVWGFVRAYWPAALISALAAALLWWVTTFFTALLFLIVAGVAAIGYWVYWDITRNVVKNNYGLCSGMTEYKNGLEALTPWLHGLIQEAAGRNTAGNPLTFGDLWGARDFPPKWLKLSRGARVRSIDLQMFTTNLSHSRPYVLPDTEAGARLFYNPHELSPYLPENVLRWIDEHARPYERNPRSLESDPSPEAAEKLGLKELPRPKDLPVLLAARMSLSFPLLFSAVPLWASIMTLNEATGASNAACSPMGASAPISPSTSLTAWCRCGQRSEFNWSQSFPTATT